MTAVSRALKNSVEVLWPLFRGIELQPLTLDDIATRRLGILLILSSKIVFRHAAAIICNT